MKALSLLKYATNVELVTSLAAAIAAMPKQDRPVEIASFFTSFNAQLKKVVSNQVDIVNLVNSQPVLADMQYVYQCISNAQQFVELSADAKWGSLNYPNCNVTTLSSGIRINNVGTNKGLKFNFDGFECGIAKSRYISEFVGYDMLTVEAYSAVMERVMLFAGYQEEILVQQEDGLTVPKTVMVFEEVVINDFFLKLALIKASAVSLDSLLMNPNYILCLSINKGCHIKPISHPMTNDSIRTIVWDMFGKPTFTEPGKANVGYIGFDVDLKGLAIESEFGFDSFLSAKKFVARQEKLNGDTSIATVNTRVFLVNKSSAASNVYFNTGCIYASVDLLNKTGVCRFTSDFNNLLIKGASHYAPMILGPLGQTVTVLASSAAKGGLAGLLANKGMAIDFGSYDPDSEVPAFEVETLTLLNGDVVSGVYCDVTLKITNAYTIENYMRSRGEKEVESLEHATALDLADKVNNLVSYDRGASKALASALLTEVSDSGMDIMSILKAKVLDKEIRLKPAVTTYTQAEYENIAITYGDGVAEAIMATVMGNEFNRIPKLETVAAHAYLKGTVKSSARVISVGKLLVALEGLVDEHGYDNQDKLVNSLSVSFARDIVKHLGLKGNSICSSLVEWVHIPEMDVVFPIGKLLYKDLFESENDFELSFQLPKILKYVLSTLLYLLQASVKGHLKPDLTLDSGFSLQFMVQDGFLNKGVSKLKVHGRYFTLLPGFWLDNVYDICILDRDQYAPSSKDEEFIRVNMAKHPLLFLEAVAGFNCYKNLPKALIKAMEGVGKNFRKLFASVVFVHPDYLLQLQNDVDGDLARVDFGNYPLPLYRGLVMDSIARSFHQDYIDDENDLGFSLTKLPKKVSFDHIALYDAIKEASVSKGNVALFTDNLHKVLAAYRTSPLLARVSKAYGKETGALLMQDVCILVATLIQTDAMNAIKHEGTLTCGDSLTAMHICAEDGYAVARANTLKYIQSNNFVVNPVMSDMDFAGLVASTLLHLHNVFLPHNKAKDTLNNQFERMVFKDQAKELIILVDEDDKEIPAMVRVNWYGKFECSWNITGDDNMFTKYVERYYSLGR